MCIILIADDDPGIRDGLKKIIVDHLAWASAILVASDGQQAWDILCSQPVDIVIADIKMPCMDGITLLQEIKNSQLPCQVAILSSYDDYSLIRTALKMEAFDYLLKPVNIPTLLQVLVHMREQTNRGSTLSPSAFPIKPLESEASSSLFPIAFYDEAPGPSPSDTAETCLHLAQQHAAKLERQEALLWLISFFDVIAQTQPSTDVVRSTLAHWVYGLMKANDGYIEVVGSNKLTPDDILNCTKSLPTLSQLRTRFVQIMSHYIDLLIARTKQRQSIAIANALAFIENNPATATSLVAVARHLCMHPNYFSAIFKAETGISFREYRLACMVRRAKKFLSQTSLGICEIAERLGYKDVSHFNRAFKKEVGLTPGNYRQLHNK